MNILALDIGLRRTGVAYADDSVGIAFPLDTIQHKGIQDLVQPVQAYIQQKSIDHVVFGLPRLLSGEEGAQCEIVREFADLLGDALPYSFIDERYTSFQNQTDTDAAAAVQVLTTFLDQQQ